MASNGWDRGYTGQEHLTQFGIVNLNGRLYDPLMGRMMEPDPLIIGENNSQGYNRYSYALNNPLKYVDPDGHMPFLAVMGIGAAISALSYTASVALSDGGFSNWSWSNFALNGIIGAASGATTFGIGSAFGATLSNGFVGEVARAAAHGASNVFYTKLSGGDANFGTFLSGAVGSLSGIVVAKVPVLQDNYVASLGFSMTTGGISSAISGGNFLQGAVSAGLVHELNFQLHKERRKGPVGPFSENNDPTTTDNYPNIPNEHLVRIPPHVNDFDGFWGQVKYLFSGGDVNGWKYDPNGNFTGLRAAIRGTPPVPAFKSGKVIQFGKMTVEAVKFHRVIKPSILKAAGKIGNFEKVVGRNPDVIIEKGNIILRGTGPFKGKTFPTGFNPGDYFF